jgi:hypothetical protein
MTFCQAIEWPGKSGKTYTYRVYEFGTMFKQTPGNYIFAGETKPDTLSPIYIGQTGDLSERFDNHHKMPCIRREGATNICVHGSSENEETRQAEEGDLIDQWKPVCNDS